jgi:chloramphenicol O-acetyltransferase type B
MKNTGDSYQNVDKFSSWKFRNYRDSYQIKGCVKSKHIIVGDFSYCSGYYHGRPFDDCVMFLDEGDDVAPIGTIDRLIIGRFCSIASGVKFVLGGNQGHKHRWIASYPLDFLDDDFDGYATVPPKGQERRGDTIVGNDVWIAVEAMIMPGVVIADGAVVGARGLVTRNIGPYEICGGNPARLTGKRFPDSHIEKLLKIKWWDWDLDKIRRNLSLLRSPNVEALSG